MSSSLKKDFTRLFERALPEGTWVKSVYSVPSNGSQLSFLCHHVTEDGDVTIVDINSIEAKHSPELVTESLPRGFCSQDTLYLKKVVWDSPCCINHRLVKNLPKTNTICFEHPIVFSYLVFSSITCEIVLNVLFSIHFDNFRNAFEHQVV